MDINFSCILVLEDGRTFPVNTRAVDENEAKTIVAKYWLLDKHGSNNINDIIVAREEYTVFVTR